jgi:hypothetical protein
VNCIDPTGLSNEIGDFGTSVYSVSIGGFDDVRNLREEMFDFKVALPWRTTGVKCFNSSEINAVHGMDGYDVISGGQASAALWSMQHLSSLLSKVGTLFEKYGSLDRDTLTAINDTADKMRDVETGWDEYASKSGNFIDMETGRPRSNAGLRNLTQKEVQEIYSARTADYGSRNPVMGLESTFLDPIDIVAGKFAAGAFLGKTALGAFSGPTAERGVLLGEYMPRVRVAGKATHLRVWPAKNWGKWVDEGVEVQKNRRWLLDQINRGEPVFSLGKTPGLRRGDYYREEVSLLLERGYRRRFDRLINVPGFGEVKLYKWIQP